MLSPQAEKDIDFLFETPVMSEVELPLSSNSIRGGNIRDVPPFQKFLFGDDEEFCIVKSEISGTTCYTEHPYVYDLPKLFQSRFDGLSGNYYWKIKWTKYGDEWQSRKDKYYIQNIIIFNEFHEIEAKYCIYSTQNKDLAELWNNLVDWLDGLLADGTIW